MNNPAPRSPDERLTDLSLMLGRGADACDKSFWLLTPLMALIATWLRDMAESLATLAALIREGKLLPQPASAPREGDSLPAGQRNPLPNRSPSKLRPKPAASAQVHIPCVDPETAELPAAAPEPASRALRPWSPGPNRPPLWRLRPGPGVPQLQKRPGTSPRLVTS